MVLEALCRPPFEPIEDISDRHLTIKTTFLLAISSLKRVGDLLALSVAPAYLDFAPGLAKAKSPARDVSPIHWTDYTRGSERGHAEGIPIASRRSVSFPSWNHGYICNLGRFLFV